MHVFFFQQGALALLLRENDGTRVYRITKYHRGKSTIGNGNQYKLTFKWKLISQSASPSNITEKPEHNFIKTAMASFAHPVPCHKKKKCSKYQTPHISVQMSAYIICLNSTLSLREFKHINSWHDLLWCTLAIITNIIVWYIFFKNGKADVTICLRLVNIWQMI